jgi:hypothetical protein
MPMSSLFWNHVILTTFWIMGCRYGKRGRPPVLISYNPYDGSQLVQMQYEIYSVNESCLDQQLLCATCIAADAFRSLTGVKLIRRLHGEFSLRFHVVDELHATAFELKIQVKLCHM